MRSRRGGSSARIEGIYDSLRYSYSCLFFEEKALIHPPSNGIDLQLGVFLDSDILR